MSVIHVHTNFTVTLGGSGGLQTTSKSPQHIWSRHCSHQALKSISCFRLAKKEMLTPRYSIIDISVLQSLFYARLNRTSQRWWRTSCRWRVRDHVCRRVRLSWNVCLWSQDYGSCHLLWSSGPLRCSRYVTCLSWYASNHLQVPSPGIKQFVILFQLVISKHACNYLSTQTDVTEMF